MILMTTQHGSEHGLVEGGNDWYDIGIIAEFSSNRLNDRICAVNIVLAQLPLGGIHFLTRVIEPVWQRQITYQIIGIGSKSLSYPF